MEIFRRRIIVQRVPRTELDGGLTQYRRLGRGNRDEGIRIRSEPMNLMP